MSSTRKRYSETFKQLVVLDYTNGLSLEEVATKHSIAKSTASGWTKGLPRYKNKSEFKVGHPHHARKSGSKRDELRFLKEEEEFKAGTLIPTIRKAKFLLFRIRGTKCEICTWEGIHPITNNPIVQMDHINGDASDNTISNLRLICPNCHAMTPTFGSLNNGNGKRKRY